MSTRFIRCLVGDTTKIGHYSDPKLFGEEWLVLLTLAHFFSYLAYLVVINCRKMTILSLFRALSTYRAKNAPPSFLPFSSSILSPRLSTNARNDSLISGVIGTFSGYRVIAAGAPLIIFSVSISFLLFNCRNLLENRYYKVSNLLFLMAVVKFLGLQEIGGLS